MSRKKQNMVRFSVTVPAEVKQTLQQLADDHGRSLAVEAGRILEAAVKAHQLHVAPEAGEPSR